MALLALFQVFFRSLHHRRILEHINRSRGKRFCRNLYALFSRPGFEEYLRARSVHPGEPLTPLTPEELHQAEEQGHATFWDVSKGPHPPGVPHP